MKRLVTILMSVTLCVSLVHGCKKRVTHNNSQLNHQVGALLRSDAPVLWRGRTASEEIKTTSQTYLELTHPATKRVLYWAEELDKLAREHFPALAVVPKPSALVVKNREANAYVQGERQCFSVPIKRQGGNDKTPLPPQLSLQLGAGSLTTVSKQEECSPAALSKTDRASLIKVFNSAGTSCQLVEKNTFIEANETCFSGDPTLKPYTHAGAFSFTTTKPIIFVHTGLILHANDWELATVVAHELGHYYRAHTSSLLPPVSYLFRHNQYDPNGIPRPIPELIDLSERWRKTFRMSLYKQPARRTDMHPAIMRKYRQWMQFMREHCAEKKCSQSCTKAYQMTLDFPDNYVAVEQGEPMDSAENKFYEDFTTQIFSCGVDLPVSNGIFVEPSFILGIEVSGVPGDTGGARNFAEQLAHASKVVTKIEKEVLDLQALVEKEQLGWYTEEQEADDILLEMIQLAGIPNENAISYRVKALTQWSKESKIPVVGQWEAGPCMKAYEKGWKNDKNENLIVPVGMWEDAHHSACYRLFNITQEIARHKYPQIPARLPKLSDEQFRVIQESVIGENESSGFANDENKRARWY